MNAAPEAAYEACLNELFNLRRLRMKLRLDTIRGVLSRLDNPHQRFKSVHVAGTNGKGSTSAHLAAILQAGGFRTGLFTSPHLVRFNERFRIDGHVVGDEEVVAAFEQVRLAQRQNEEHMTFFEMCAAMAFLIFARREVDWAVVETGMGGRLDATNVLTPEVTVITNIALDHQIYLGDTLSDIAREKAGIIKPGVSLVTGVKQPPAWGVVESTARRHQAPVYRLGKAFRVRRRGHDNDFTYFGIDTILRDLKTRLEGSYQVDNATMAIAACELINQKQPTVDPEVIRNGLTRVAWPGRLQVVSRDPLVILDGAHNLAAAQLLAHHLRQHLGHRKLVLVIGILDDKAFDGMLAALAPFCSRIVATQPNYARALPPEQVAQAAQKYVSRVCTKPSVAAAIEHALATVQSHEAVCVAGSLYLVGEALAYFEHTTAPDPGELL
jgi:dihydrofolate synthase/folylpolyglutamate synthase